MGVEVRQAGAEVAALKPAWSGSLEAQGRSLVSLTQVPRFREGCGESLCTGSVGDRHEG